MKKLLLILVFILISCQVYATEVNMPSAPQVYVKRQTQGGCPISNTNPQSVTSTTLSPSVPTSSTTGSSSSYGGPLAGIAQPAASAMLNGVVYMDKYDKAMQKAGATGMAYNVVSNGCPRRKYLPPQTIGGKTFTNKTKCATVRYSYKGKDYEYGACK